MSSRARPLSPIVAFLLFVPLLLLLLLLLPPLPGAVLGAEIGFDPPLLRTDGPECADSTLTVELVLIGPVTGIQGFSIAFLFDPALLRPTAVRPGTVLADQPAPVFFRPLTDGFAAGRIQIDAAVLGATCDAPSPYGGMALAEIEFLKVAGGAGSPRASALAPVAIDFRDGRNQGIAVEGVAGTVEILPCILPVTEVSWGRIKARAPR